MRNPLSDKIVDIKPSGIRKFFDIVSEMDDAISLGVGEPDFDTPWHIRDEGIYSLEKGRTFYTSNAGLKELKIEICNYLERRFHLTYNYANEVLVTVGGSEAIDIALRTMVNPGDEVLIPQPSYVSYEPCAVLADAVPVIINLKAENEFRLTAQELRDAITDKTKVLVLPFPNNPTGAIMEKKDLEEIAEVILEKDLFVISDEIYSELTYKADHVSIASIPGMQERTILINGFSKSYAMTGWRLGYAAAPVDFIKAMVRVHQYINTCAASFVQEAGITALEKAEPDVQEMVKEYARRRDYMVSAINSMDGVSCKTPGGAFYVFMNIKSFGMSSADMANYLLEEAKIATVPGSAFGSQGEGYVRFSYACSYERIVEGMERMRKALAKLPKKA